MDSGSYICYHRIITKASSSSGICKLRYIAKEEVKNGWMGVWGN
jgi:hypothetical protein